MTEHEALLEEVRGCDLCKERGLGFDRQDGTGPFFKFPPTIGATGQAWFLFVGINPRKTPDNADLHERIMRHRHEFIKLAKNHDDQLAYIAPGCKERHYRRHIAFVQRHCGPDAKFEDHAAVTELYFCATSNARALPREESPCADSLFFEGVS